MRIIVLLLLACIGSAHAEVSYRVSADVAAGELRVAACVDRAYAELRLDAQPGAFAYLLSAERNDGGGVMRSRRDLIARDLPADACVTTRIAAAVAAGSRRRDEGMLTAAGTWLLSPGVWLWRADEAGTLTLDLPDGMRASLPWQPRDAAHRTYALDAGGGDWPAWAAFGAIDERAIAGGEGTALRVAVVDPPNRARADELHQWLRETAQTTLSAYGRFPVPNAQVLVLEIDGRGDSPVPWGQTTRGGGVAVELFVRRGATLAQLRDDWTAAHELSHLFHPYLGERGRWLAEGLASYYQNVLRARAGMVSESYAWAHLDSGFARGRASAQGTPLRELGRVRGGDGKPGEGTMRIYWSGAAFWLQADIALRRERGFGVERVLSDYARCCLPAAEGVDADAFIARLDRLSGSQVFSALAREYANAPRFPDLDTSYRELGLSIQAGEPRLNDDPAARRLRLAIMGRPAESTAASAR